MCGSLFLFHLWMFVLHILFPQDDAETIAIREKVIAARQKVFTALGEEVRKRWTFEEAIKRPYFHVKPLERVQLKNWREYLDFEIGNGDHRRVVILFERCVIACALYEDFWQRFASYMEAHDVEACRHVYERACTIHLPRKPSIHLAWAAFEEQQGESTFFLSGCPVRILAGQFISHLGMACVYWTLKK